MMDFHYVAVFLLYYFAIGAESKFIAPTIFQGNEIVVNTGDNLTLTCQGVEPLTWTIVNYNKINYDKNSIIKSEINDEISQVPYGSFLKIQNVSYLNTGFFYCHGTKANKDDSLRSTNIYVYVKDELRLSLVPPEELAVFLAKPKTKLTIPCLPTSPDVKVSLLSDEGEEVASTESNFDPRTGFKIRMLNWEQEVYCVFTRNNQNQTITIFLDDSSLPKIETSLVYDSNDKYITFIGNILVLRCSIIIPYNSFHRFKWTLNYNDIEENSRISIKNNPLISIASGKLLTSSIIINNITKEDEGQYDCLAIVYSDIGGHASTYITVTDTAREIAPPKINFTGSEIIIHAQESLTLLCNGTEPINWFTDDLYIPMDNINITTYQESKYVYKAILRISNAKVESAGSYVCKPEHVKNNNPFRTRKIFIYVKDRNHLSKYVGNYGDVKLIMWKTRSYIPCIPSSPDVNVSLIDSKGLKIQSDLAIYSPKLGFDYFGRDRGLRNYKCLYQRGNITQEMTIRTLVINDPKYEETHFIGGPKKESIYAGENLLLNCSMIIYDAVMFNYSDLFLNWTIPESLEVEDNVLIQDEQSYPLANGKILIKQLTVKNVDLRAEGDYECILYDSLLNQVNYVSKYITILEQINAELIIIIPDRKYIVTSETLVLFCNVRVNHNVKFSLHWSYNKYIQNTNRISETSLKIKEDILGLIGSISLTIKNVTLEDAGIYKCTIKNGLDLSKSVEQNITIHDPSKWTIRIAFLVILIIVLTVLFIILVIKSIKEKKLEREIEIAGLHQFQQEAIDSINPSLGVDSKAELLPYDKSYENQQEKLRLGKYIHICDMN